MAGPALHVHDFARKTLKPRHALLMPKLAEAYFAQGEPMDPERLEAFSREVDAAMSTASKTLRFGLVLMLDVIMWSPLFVIGRASTFENLSLEDRGRFLLKLERHPIVPLALVFVAWKTLLTMVYFEDPRELASLGYPGAVRTRYLTVVTASDARV
jgi:hypothetical protein